jgi:hypothetical protein
VLLPMDKSNAVEHRLPGRDDCHALVRRSGM